MNRISEKYKYDIHPLANEASTIRGDKYRFTVLTNRMIRIEYNENGIFEDRATQLVVNRYFDKPDFKVEEDEEKLRIKTDRFVLTYYKGRPFTKSSLNMKYVGINASPWNDWHYGEVNLNTPNLKGTVRTLDSVSGEVPLENGIMSKGGFAEIDDSKSLIIAEDGWVDRHEEKSVDMYIIACIDDYQDILKDYFCLSGKVPLLPRYAFGNMWSRFHRYTQQEYLDLMNRFEKENCPFSVAVIDMDWHIVDGGKKYGTGWTGYTWNKALFPDYKAFLKELHDRGLEVTLNLHPGDGVAPYEEAYKAMADAMGVNPKEDVPIEFDCANPHFLENYFEILHHPYEKDGVTFWWMDWQQGNTSKEEGIDPLWMLNHYHSIDMQNSGKRPVMLSRYAGLGSHRYPIGFSGDAVMDWETLDFQPYFTVNATNAGYTWWSHDIGGHWGGYRDSELYVRWLQFGVFSPINRLHSTMNPVLGKEPWNYDEITQFVSKSYLQLRHRLIPYLYTMNYRTSFLGEALMQPIYYRNNVPEAYDKRFRNEYYFGTEILVLPITKKSDCATLMGSTDAYIPEGIWFDFFNGRCYKGGKVLNISRNLTEYPVLVKAGGIIPMAVLESWNDISNPKTMEIAIYPGANNSFELYEDDGKTMEYKNGAYVITKMDWDWDNKIFTISAPEGDESVIQKSRNYRLMFKNIINATDITVTGDGKEIEFKTENDESGTSVCIDNVSSEITVQLNRNVKVSANDYKKDIINLAMRMEFDNNVRENLYYIAATLDNKLNILTRIDGVTDNTDINNAVKEYLLADEIL